MGQLWRLVYNLLLVPIMVLAAYALVPVNRKVRRGLRGRRRTLSRVARFREKIYDRFGPLYWFHVASHGEYEQARPVIDGLRGVVPESIIVVSFFSPSGYENFEHEAVDFRFYLPIDFPWVMRQLLRTLKPQRVIFTSYDLWPNLIWACRNAGIPTTLFAARIVPGSTKQWPVLSSFYRQIYSAIGDIYTVSEADFLRVREVVGPRGSTEVRNLGNPRYDRVKERNTGGALELRNGRQRIVVLGSVHKEDEAVICPALFEILAADKSVQLLWAPHEPEPEVLASIGAMLSEAGIAWERFGRRLGRFRESQVLIVDGVGYLAELYGRGILAYVGGGFGSNVHNVMEAAIAGIPVLFGPRYSRSHEAEQLVESGGGIAVASSEEFRQGVLSFLEDETRREEAGRAALKVIEDNLGATARVLQAILGD
ncbi:MAG: glycosyltransferase N-terminal domain-containing protein [Candidatus Neomarinimicrobiota bacterium]